MFHRSDKILKLECSVFFSLKIIASHVNQYVLFWFHPSIKPFSNSPLACPHLFLESSSFRLATLPCTPLLSVLLMVGSWTWTLANVRKAFSCLEVTLWTFATSQTFYTFCFGVIFVGRPLLRKVTEVLNFLHLYTICLTVDLWSPNTLEMVCKLF